jgi:SAM-dependent methyltransferase
MTANWMSGYVADVNYTLGFYRELSPIYLDFACVVNGFEGIKVTKPLRYCELGCGRGYGTALLAAANPNIKFVGIDFNPSHIAEARALAAQAELSNLSFYEMSFADAAKSADPKLANFDIVVMHGVYTWVLPRVRTDIHDFVREKLLAGGLFYISYNTMPGWATVAPIQRLIMEVGERSSRDSIAVIEEAQNLLKSLIDHSSAFVTQNPGVKTRLERIAKQDKSYLAHEFLNSGWQPHFVTDVITNLSESKLTYAGSASLLENRIDLCVPKNLQEIVRNAPDVPMRELLKDYAINKQFRRDIYIKGPQSLTIREQRQRIGELAFASTLMVKNLPKKLQIPVGEVTIKPEALAMIMDAVGDKVVTGNDIFAAGNKKGVNDSETIFRLLLLISAGAISPARPDHQKVDRKPAQRMNEYLMHRAIASDTHRFVASPVLGSAINAPFMDRVSQPLIVKAPKLSAQDIARLAFDELEKSGQAFRRDGKPLAKTEENIQEISKFVSEFREQRLPRWHVLGVVAS